MKKETFSISSLASLTSTSGRQAEKWCWNRTWSAASPVSSKQHLWENSLITTSSSVLYLSVNYQVSPIQWDLFGLFELLHGCKSFQLILVIVDTNIYWCWNITNVHFIHRLKNMSNDDDWWADSLVSSSNHCGIWIFRNKLKKKRFSFIGCSASYIDWCKTLSDYNMGCKWTVELFLCPSGEISSHILMHCVLLLLLVATCSWLHLNRVLLLWVWYFFIYLLLFTGQILDKSGRHHSDEFMN